MNGWSWLVAVHEKSDFLSTGKPEKPEAAGNDAQLSRLPQLSAAQKGGAKEER